jgi:tripartite-type tricarboxylate transporter receptor subunit TctC
MISLSNAIALRFAAGVAALVCVCAQTALAYPSRPVRLVAPFAPGSGGEGYAFDAWYGMHAPARTPRDIIISAHVSSRRPRCAQNCKLLFLLNILLPYKTVCLPEEIT